MTLPTSSGPRPSQIALAFVLLVLMGLGQMKWGEVISVGGGQGWDGRTYVLLAQDLPRQVTDAGVNSYVIRRIFPSAVVYSVRTAFGLSADPSAVRDVFAAYNLVMLCLTLGAWVSIVRTVKAPAWSFWMGFVLLFVNFANWVMPYYYAPLTDSTALALGGWLLAFHLSNRPGAALVILVLGTFTWASFLVFGAPLVLLRRTPAPAEASTSETTLWQRRGRLGTGLAGALGLAFLIWFAVRPQPTGMPPATLPLLGVAMTLAYVCLVCVGVLGFRPLSRVVLWWESTSPARLSAYLVTVAAVFVAIRGLASGPGFGAGYFLDHAVWYSILEPGIFLISHAVYYGVVVLLALVLWPRVSAVAYELGPGVVSFLAIHLLWGIHPESRQLIDALPALVLVVVLASREIRWPSWALLLLATSNTAASKIWFQMNREGFVGRSDPFTAPAQRYFMSLGPWMNHESYLLQGAIGLVALAGLFLWSRRMGEPSVAENKPLLLVPPGLKRPTQAALAVMCALAASELAVRLMSGPMPPNVMGPVSPGDPILGWRNEPRSVVRVEGPVSTNEMRFNALGVRGPEIKPKTAGERRVLLLGGSYVEGSNVPENETVSALLESTLQTAGVRSEAINGGVVGYATDQSSLWYRRLKDEINADEVVVFVSAEDAYLLTTGFGGKPVLRLEGDSTGPVSASLEVSARPRRSGPWPSQLSFKRSLALRRLSEWTFDHVPVWHRRLATVGLVERTEPPPSWAAYGLRGERDPMWQSMRGVLESIKAAAGPDVPLIVVYVPQRFEIDDSLWAVAADRYDLSKRPWDRDKPAARLAVICERLQLPFVDTRATLRDVLRSGSEPFSSGQSLWSPEGNRAVADAVARVLGPAR